MNRLDTIKTHCFSRAHADRSPHQRLRVNHFLYFFHIFKELLTINGESWTVNLVRLTVQFSQLIVCFLPPTALRFTFHISRFTVFGGG